MTPQEAVDAIGTVFKDAWDTTGGVAVYDDLPGSVPSTDKLWARLTVRHAAGGQASLAGDSGQRRWGAEGTVFIQVFAPMGDGAQAARNAAHVVMNAFRDAKLPVWFRNTQMREVGASGAFFQINVLTTFSYDEVR